MTLFHRQIQALALAWSAPSQNSTSAIAVAVRSARNKHPKPGSAGEAELWTSPRRRLQRRAPPRSTLPVSD